MGAAEKAVRAELAGRPSDDPVAQFYASRSYAPLWSDGVRPTPEAGRLLSLLDEAGRDLLAPGAYRPETLASEVAQAKSGKPPDIARADIDLTRSFAAYAADLHRPPADGRMLFADPAAPPAPTSPADVLRVVARARSTADAFKALVAVNPIYAALRAELAATPAGDPRAATLRLNLERARALPGRPGDRYILVDPAAQTLWLYDHGHVIDTMRVIVGKPTEPTPDLIGVIRYAALHPYWEAPPDLTRNSIAPKVLALGPGYLATRHFQVLSDWSDHATVVAPQSVDWPAVASGAQMLRVRQLPGADNMMGQVKYMLPNPLGVYLHDTPNKALFADDTRTDSAGCIRLADAAELGRRLFGRSLVADPHGPPDQRVNLRRPVPVYVIYLTAMPGASGPTFYPDVYGRDRQPATRLAQQQPGR